jgi:glycerophosphoryl diester phosphodiesterase
MPRPFEVQGHRGARGRRPENTLPSFEAALDACVGSIETDLHLTRDGVVVLAHDAIISHRCCRLDDARFSPAPTHLPRIADLTQAQLRGYAADVNPDRDRFPEQKPDVTPLAAHFAAEHGREPYLIPTLAQIFAFAAAYAGSPGAAVGKNDAQRDAAAHVVFDLELKRVPFHIENGDDYTGRGPGALEKRTLATIRAAGVSTRTRILSFDHRCVRFL